MISPTISDDDLRALFTRKPELSETTQFWLGMSDALVNIPDQARCKDCGGTGEIRNFDNGTIKPCLACNGTSLRARRDLGDTQEIDVDAVLARSAPCVDPQVEMNDTVRWLEAQQPVPELSEHMQAVSGFFTSLVWAIEDRTPLEQLSDDQREILARVSQFMEQYAETKNAE